MGPLFEISPFLIPIIALCIPIVAIMTTHQQKMAAVFAQRNNGNQGEVDALRREVAELKELAHQQAIAMDSLTQLIASQVPPVKANIQDRLSV